MGRVVAVPLAQTNGHYQRAEQVDGSLGDLWLSWLALAVERFLLTRGNFKRPHFGRLKKTLQIAISRPNCHLGVALGEGLTDYVSCYLFRVRL